MTPFEIRLDLLKMAQGMLETEYFAKRERISTEYSTACDVARATNSVVPSHPEFPSYPSEDIIIAKARVLNSFVSQKP